MKKVLMILCVLGLWGSVSATIRYVTYGTQTFVQANAAATSGDTLEFTTNDTQKTSITLKNNLLIRSSATTNDTLFQLPTISSSIITAITPTRVTNLRIQYTAAAPSGVNYQFFSNNIGGHVFTNVVFDSGQIPALSTKRGVAFRKATGRTLTTNKILFVNCKFNGTYNNQQGATDTTLADSVEFSNCEFNKCQWSYGKYYNVHDSRWTGMLDETMLFSGYLKFYNNYIDLNGFASEAFSGEQTARVLLLDSMDFHNNVFKNSAHVCITMDAFTNFSVRNNRFISSPGSSNGSCLYHHNNQLGTHSENGIIENNYIENNLGYSIIWAVKAKESQTSNIIIRNNIFGLNGTIGTDSINSLTLSKCVFSKAAQSCTFTPNIAPFIPTVSDTLRGKSMSAYLLDSTYFFQQRGKIGVYSTASDDSSTYCGPTKYLLYKKGAGNSLTTSGFAAKCSLSTNLWLTNFATKDSTKIYLDLSTDKGTYTIRDSTVKIPGGWSDSLRISGLTQATKYYYRFVSGDITVKRDTTEIDSITTLSGGAPPPTITSQPSRDSVTIGATASFSVTATGTGTLSYQWQRLHGTWSNVGTNSNTYSFTAAAVDNGDSVFVTVTDDNRSTASNKVACIVLQLPSFTYATNPASYTQGTTITSNATSHTIAIDGFTGTIPAGLSLNATSGAITGKPTVYGNGTYRITSTNASGTSYVDLVINIAQISQFTCTISGFRGTVSPATYTGDSGSVFSISSDSGALWDFSTTVIWSGSVGTHITNANVKNTTCFMSANGTVTATYYLRNPVVPGIVSPANNDTVKTTTITFTFDKKIDSVCILSLYAGDGVTLLSLDTTVAASILKTLTDSTKYGYTLKGGTGTAWSAESDVAYFHVYKSSNIGWLILGGLGAFGFSAFAFRAFRRR
jgi:hypothetical protein